MAYRIDVRKRQPVTLALKSSTFAILAATSLSLAGPLDFAKKIDFEMTGTVYDADTKEPIEGAYVVVPYKVFRGGLGGSGTFCVKTKGMYTGKDGQYHFPVEKLDGRNPYLANAIKAGHYFKDAVIPDSSSWVKQNAATYRSRHIYLKKQDPANPVWQLSSNGDEKCTEAPTREAAAAGVNYMKLQLAEYKRFKGREFAIPSFEKQIQHYENLPSEGVHTK